jgi:hypothetical protein
LAREFAKNGVCEGPKGRCERVKEKETPACIVSAAIIAVGTTSGGGLGAFVGKKLAGLRHVPPGILHENSKVDYGQTLMSSQPILTPTGPSKGEFV